LFKEPVLQSWLKISTVVILGVLILNSKHSVFAQVISPQRLSIEVLGKQGEMLIGADYYPEHWPKERWETDLKLMKGHLNVIYH